MKANKGFKTTKKTHLFATRGFLTFLVSEWFLKFHHKCVAIVRYQSSNGSMDHHAAKSRPSTDTSDPEKKRSQVI